VCAVYVGQAVLAELRRIIEESEIIRCAAHRRHLTATLTSTTITTTFSSTPFATALTALAAATSPPPSPPPTPACAPGRRPARPAAQRDPHKVRLTRTGARAARTQGG